MSDSGRRILYLIEGRSGRSTVTYIHNDVRNTVPEERSGEQVLVPSQYCGYVASEHRGEGAVEIRRSQRRYCDRAGHGDGESVQGTSAQLIHHVEGDAGDVTRADKAGSIQFGSGVEDLRTYVSVTAVVYCNRIVSGVSTETDLLEAGRTSGGIDREGSTWTQRVERSRVYGYRRTTVHRNGDRSRIHTSTCNTVIGSQDVGSGYARTCSHRSTCSGIQTCSR